MESSGSVSCSPDGNRIASVSIGGHVRIFDTATGKRIVQLKKFYSGEYCDAVAYSTDGNEIAVSYYGVTRIHDLKNRKHFDLISWPSINQALEDLVYSPDGKTIATASDYGKVEIWDAKNKGKPLLLLQHARVVSAIAYSPDGKQLVSAAFDNKIRIWDLETGLCCATLSGADINVTRIRFSSDGKRIISESLYGVKVWEIEQGRILFETKQPFPMVRSSDGRIFVTRKTPDENQIQIVEFD